MYPTFLEPPLPLKKAKKGTERKRYFSESVYTQPNQNVIRYALQAALDWAMLVWNTILISVILLMMGALQAFLSISDEQFKSSKWLRVRRGKELLYRITPTRLISRLWGVIHSWRIPPLARPLVYRLYSFIYNVNIAEAAEPNLTAYPNLGAFFRRPIDARCRPLAQTNLVSPCDGKVLTMGRVDDGAIEQIKGQSFTVAQFLGADIDCEQNANFSYRGDDRDNRVRYCQSLLRQPESNDLFYCVIYLAPGDYHRFHSPCNFRVDQRRHFPGALYSVNPSISCWLDNLFCVNERVTLMGEWMHGFFSYTAVGATMVGSIKLGWDAELKTNRWNKRAQTKDIQKHFKKGQEIGEFNLGSTIVLIYEAPRHYSFTIKENQSLKLGAPLTVRMKKRHSMPNLQLQTTKTASNSSSTMKQSETFDSSNVRLRK